MAAKEGTAIIGPSVKLRGELFGTEDIEFHGHVDGSIRLEDARLTIGQQATVRGEISATEVVVQGRVDGNILATERVKLLASAVVEGEILAPRLVVEAGAELHAVVDLTSTPEPEPVAQAPAPAASAAPAKETPAADGDSQTALFNGSKPAAASDAKPAESAPAKPAGSQPRA